MILFYIFYVSDITDKIEAEMSPKPKREKRALMRFEPWKEGDAYSPMSVKSKKSKQKGEQKKFREMRKQKAAAESAKEDSSKGDAVQGPDKQAQVKKTKKKLQNITNSSKKIKKGSFFDPLTCFRYHATQR